MKYYYSTNGIEKNGPLSFEKLKSKNITPQTLIWHEGMDDWKAAIEIPKVKTLFDKQIIISSKAKNSGKIAASTSNSLPPKVKNKNSIKPIKLEKIIEKPVIEKPQSFSWWRFDDEYITGWQYFGRSVVGWLFFIVIIGFYLQAVTAYKRSNSLGNSNSTNNFFKIWGGISMILGLIPGIALLNIIPHWYLWFSSGTGYVNKI